MDLEVVGRLPLLASLLCFTVFPIFSFHMFYPVPDLTTWLSCILFCGSNINIHPATLDSITLKIKQLIYQQKQVYSGIAENCNSGLASYRQNHGQVWRTKGRNALREERPSWEDCSKQKVLWCKLRASCIVASHWPICDSLSFSGLLLEIRQKSSFLLLGSKVDFFLQLTRSGGAQELPLLASWGHVSKVSLY